MKYTQYFTQNLRKMNKLLKKQAIIIEEDKIKELKINVDGKKFSLNDKLPKNIRFSLFFDNVFFFKTLIKRKKQLEKEEITISKKLAQKKQELEKALKPGQKIIAKVKEIKK